MSNPNASSCPKSKPDVLRLEGLLVRNTVHLEAVSSLSPEESSNSYLALGGHLQ